MAIAIKANDRAQVIALACFIVKTNETEWPELLGHAYFHRLMNFAGSGVGWGMRLVRRLKGREGCMAFFRELQRHDPKAVRSCLVDMASHVMNGHDTEDKDSAGGWSQREIDLFLLAVGQR